MTERPDIPRKLATKIISAQKKVDDVRSMNAHSLRRRAQDQARIAEFETDPEAFAKKYYQRHPVNSYPVQTNIGRCRDNVAHSISRDEARRVRLAEAEENLANIEREVLATVQKMRPSEGRVPWPATRTVEDWQRDEDAMLAEHARQEAIWAKEREAELAIFEAECEAEMAEIDAQREREMEELREEAKSWRPERKAAAWKRSWQNIIDDLRAGKFGLSDAGEYIDGGSWKRR